MPYTITNGTISAPFSTTNAAYHTASPNLGGPNVDDFSYTNYLTDASYDADLSSSTPSAIPCPAFPEWPLPSEEFTSWDQEATNAAIAALLDLQHACPTRSHDPWGITTPCILGHPTCNNSHPQPSFSFLFLTLGHDNLTLLDIIHYKTLLNFT
jgi:hypothetical protein